ncbi:hypothetical protein BpHYR1_037902 [Brachionus plicatilis]|uniref:Uncharacterized protein n=1 Tax=Brachionus plicatilis TaxID=10195 RepID=A0A3M7T3L5_BRAPC|nr:hypothetical protein BpHYR1_037902 [Brachionus plicatilis]
MQDKIFKIDKDFKKFWSFYKIKEDVTLDDVPDYLLDGEDVVTEIIDKANLFNKFFTNLKSESLFNDDDCSQFIFKQFKDQSERVNQKEMASSMNASEPKTLMRTSYQVKQ